MADDVASRMGTPAVHFWRRAVLFSMIGVLLYLALYVAAEELVHHYGERNRFYRIIRTPPTRFDFVVLGASHAAVFDYRAMNTRLEQLTHSRVMNLSVVGGGVTVGRLLFDHFVAHHRADTLLYVVDSFTFYSPQWNEERLKDRELFRRAPFDPALARLLLRQPRLWATALDYVTGFAKINDRDRFSPDVPAEQGPRFDRRYRPIAQIDRARLAYLYPAVVDRAVVARYVQAFDDLVAAARAEGMRILAIKPPLPERVHQALPAEAEFDAAISGVLARHAGGWHDFSRVNNDDAQFYDTDHLNRDGVLSFYKEHLVPLLREHLAAGDELDELNRASDVPPTAR